MEQTETQESNKQRVKDSLDWKGKRKALDKFEKQTRREVCRISTPVRFPSPQVFDSETIIISKIVNSKIYKIKTYF